MQWSREDVLPAYSLCCKCDDGVGLKHSVGIASRMTRYSQGGLLLDSCEGRELLYQTKAWYPPWHNTHCDANQGRLENSLYHFDEFSFCWWIWNEKLKALVFAALSISNLQADGEGGLPVQSPWERGYHCQHSGLRELGYSGLGERIGILWFGRFGILESPNQILSIHAQPCNFNVTCACARAFELRDPCWSKTCHCYISSQYRDKLGVRGMHTFYKRSLQGAQAA